MFLLKSISLLGLAATSLAYPLELEQLLERDGGACYPENMVIGQSDTGCPKVNTLDSSGHCSAGIPNVPGTQGCTAYCETRIVAQYGQEVPIMDGSCQSGTVCSVSKSQSVTVTNGYSISLSATGVSGEDVSKILTSSFNLGASYTYSKSVGYTTTETFSKTLDATTCGYWTFIPYLMMSCGTLTSTPTGQIPTGVVDEPYCEKKDYSDTGNWCNTTPFKDSNGHAEGKVLFVLTDCGTNAVLKTGQDPAYEYPGVSTGPK